MREGFRVFCRDRSRSWAVQKKTVHYEAVRVCSSSRLSPEWRQWSISSEECFFNISSAGRNAEPNTGKGGDCLAPLNGEGTFL